MQQTISISHKKNFTIDIFRQILFVAPDLYDHQWKQGSSVEPQLAIQFKSGAKNGFVNKEELNRRSEFLLKKLLEHTEKFHTQFLEKLQETEEVPAKFFSPQKTQMWHHKFNPHENPLVTAIPKGSLKEQQKHLVKHGSSSVQDYLNKNCTKQSMIQQAITKSTEEDNTAKN